MIYLIHKINNLRYIMEKLEQIKLYLNQIFENKIEKIIFSNPAKNFEYKKIIVELKQNSYLVSAFTNTQVFHKNIKTENILNFILENEKTIVNLIFLVRIVNMQ